MARVKNLTDRIELPHEPGNFFILRKLTGKQLRKAAEIRSDKGAAKMKLIGGDVMVALQSVRPADLEAAKTDPLSNYDLDTLLADGVANWDGPNYTEKFSKEELDTLDLPTMEWAGRTLVEISQVTEEDRKN